MAKAARLIRAQPSAAIATLGGGVSPGTVASAASRVVQSRSPSTPPQQGKLAPVSDEAMRVIQAMWAKLCRLKQQIAEASVAEEQAAALAEERKARCAAYAEHRQQASSELGRFMLENRERQKYEQRLLEQVEASQGELAAIRLHQDQRCVPRADYSALQAELRLLVAQHSEVCEEGDDLRAQLAKDEKRLRAEADKVVENRRATLLQDAADREEVLARLGSLQKKAAREREQRAQRNEELGERNRQAEQELSRAAGQKVELEKRAEALRLHNEQLAQTLKRSQEAQDRDLAEFRDELRRRNQQIKVLSDLLMGPLSEVQPNSGRCITEAGLAEPNRGSAYLDARRRDSGPATGSTRTTRGAWRTAALSSSPGSTVEAVAEDSPEFSRQCIGSHAVPATHVVTLHDLGDLDAEVSADGTTCDFNAVQETRGGPEQANCEVNQAMDPAAVLIYNPQGGQSVGSASADEAGICESPEKRQTSTPVEPATRPSLQQERNQRLKQFTEGWGRVSGTTLSTDLSGPLLPLEEHSMSSLDSGGMWNGTEDVIR